MLFSLLKLSEALKNDAQEQALLQRPKDLEFWKV